MDNAAGFKCFTPEIALHPSNIEKPTLSYNMPVLSVDFSPVVKISGLIGRLATAGADGTARIWYDLFSLMIMATEKRKDISFQSLTLALGKSRAQKIALSVDSLLILHNILNQ